MENENRLFCSYCGKEASPGAEVCLNCGCAIRRGKNFCTNCGAQIHPEQAICIKCGASLTRYREGKNKYVAAILAFLLGLFGVHKFYLGETGTGIVYLLCGTIGWFLILPPMIISIVCLVETVLYLCMSDEEFDAKYN